MAVANDQVKILTLWFSPFGLRVTLALQLKRVQYEEVEENLADKSERLLQANPVHQKVPVLLHNGRPLAESLIIVQYIDEVWPSGDGKRLFPQDPYGRATARFWADYIDRKLFEPLLDILRTFGEVQRKAVEETFESLAVLENALCTVFAGQPFFGGTSLGYVDVILAPYIRWYPALEVMGKFKLPLEEKYPCFLAWMKRIEDLPPLGEWLLEAQKITEAAVELRRRRFVPQEE